jgi:hypothetical protein
VNARVGVGSLLMKALGVGRRQSSSSLVTRNPNSPVSNVLAVGHAIKVNAVDTLVGQVLRRLEGLGRGSNGKNSSTSGNDLAILDCGSSVEDLDV